MKKRILLHKSITLIHHHQPQQQNPKTFKSHSCISLRESVSPKLPKSEHYSEPPPPPLLPTLSLAAFAAVVVVVVVASAISVSSRSLAFRRQWPRAHDNDCKSRGDRHVYIRADVCVYRPALGIRAHVHVCETCLHNACGSQKILGRPFGRFFPREGRQSESFFEK